MLGYTAEEMIGKSSVAIFHDKNEIKKRATALTDELGKMVKPGFDVFTLKTLHTKFADRNEWTYIRKDGARFPVLLSISALWDEQEKLLGFCGIATDITDIKIADAKIKQSEAHLHALVTSLDDVVLEIDKNGIYLNLWTKRNEYLFTQRENHINKSIYDVLGNDLASKYEATIKRVIATGKPEILEYKSILPNDDHWRNAKFTVIDENRVLVCIRDITEKKKSEIELIRSEEKFRTLAENIPGVIYVCNNDAEHSMLYLNANIKNVTGYTEEEFISGEINITDLFHPDDGPEIVEKVNAALAAKESFQLNYRLKHKSGEWRFVEEVGIGVYDNNTLLFIEGFINDNTVQKLAEQKLQAVAEENYRLFNNAVNLSAISGFDGYFKRLNNSWTKLLGWTVDEMLAKPIIDFIHPDDTESTKNAIDHIAAGNNLQTFENRYRCKDGSYRWLLWGSASDVNNKLIYASAIDISERKKNEEELLRSKQNLEIAAGKLLEQNRLLDEFAHIISHNLRSPIGNIQALIGLLNKYSSVEDYQLIFDKLNNVAKNLGDTMNELMATLKAKTSEDIERVEIRFKELLDKVIQSLEGEMIHSAATITYNFNAVPKVTFAKAYLESIFQNLLTNAIKYKSPDRKPEIHISSSFNEGRIELRVSDNGLGIDLKQYGDKLFGLHKTFHDHKEAKGVGLFLTKTQVESLGGSISVESEVNKGTTFIIKFKI
jgi:PAS domain S-box-containing protein